MANVKLVYGSSTETCWSSTGKITTPSLILVDNGTTRYTPLYSGSAGATIIDGNYKATLGHLIAAGKRCALSRYQYKFTNSVTIGSYFTCNRVVTSRRLENRCGVAGYAISYTDYIDIYIKVNSKTINNGSLKHIYASSGGGTTSTSWYLTRSYAESGSYWKKMSDSEQQHDNKITYTLNAVFTSSAGTDFSTSLSANIYTWETSDTLSKEITI